MFSNTKEGVKRDAKNAARAFDQETKDSVREVTSDLSDIANRAGRKVRSYYNAASHELSGDYDVVATRIRSNPVQSSLVALGAGIVLGALLRRI